MKKATETFTRAPEATQAPLGSYTLAIMRTMMTLDRELNKANPDVTHNQGRLLGEAYLWRAVEKYASAKYDALMTEDRKKKVKGECFTSGILPDRDTLDQGDHTSVAETPHFVVDVNVSKPVERFDPEVLAKKLSKEFKKPESYFMNMVAGAKKAGNPVVKWEIKERA